MRDLILLSRKKIHFTVNKDIYKQTDVVAMASPLGPVVAGIDCWAKNTMVSRLSNHLCSWRWYIGDTFIKEGSVRFILEQLNSYHPNLQFTYELENVGKLSFLDVLVIR